MIRETLIKNMHRWLCLNSVPMRFLAIATRKPWRVEHEAGAVGLNLSLFPRFITIGHHMEFMSYRDAVMIEVPGGLQHFRLAVLVGAQKKAVVLALDCLDRHVEWEALGVLQAAERALHQVFNFLAEKRSHVQFGVGVLHKVRVPVISSAIKDLLLLCEGGGACDENQKRSRVKKRCLQPNIHDFNWQTATELPSVVALT